MRQKMLLTAAAFFGVLAFFLMFHQINAERQKALKGSRLVTYVVAKSDLIQGETITRDKLLVSKPTRRFGSARGQEIPGGSVDQIVGKKLANSVRRGQILYWRDISGYLSQEKYGMAGRVRMKWRAFSVAVDATGSVNNLIQPNNHVDIIGTFRFPAMKGDKELDTITLTLLQNVVVLATGKQMANSGGSPVYSQSHKQATRGYNTLTLELSPKEVELLAFASQKGRLDFSLRNKEDTSVVKDLQSVNFKYLQEHIPDYQQDRETNMNRRR